MSVSLGQRGFVPRALGEVAIRCRDLEAMATFYRDVIGLAPLAQRPGGIRFFALGESWRGHTAVLALFGPPGGRGAPGPAEGSALHHLALAVDWEAQAAAEAWLRGLGLPVRVERFDWIGWRGVFTEDPEGNVVELVAADPERVS